MLSVELRMLDDTCKVQYYAVVFIKFDNSSMNIFIYWAFDLHFQSLTS